MDPHTFYLPQAQSSTLWIVIGSPWKVLAAWLALINLITFFIFRLDKWKARRKAARPAIRRVPEKTLFLLAALGGSPGALLGMRVWHHKTLHTSFRIGIPLILLLQLLILTGLYLYWNPFC